MMGPWTDIVLLVTAPDTWERKIFEKLNFKSATLKYFFAESFKVYHIYLTHLQNISPCCDVWLMICYHDDTTQAPHCCDHRTRDHQTHWSTGEEERWSHCWRCGHEMWGCPHWSWGWDNAWMNHWGDQPRHCSDIHPAAENPWINFYFGRGLWIFCEDYLQFKFYIPKSGDTLHLLSEETNFSLKIFSWF